MSAICFLVAFGACVLGKICGMGGGVIIKPTLDALGVMSVASINFLSGCTVMGMSCWSVVKSLLRRDSQLDLRLSTPLAVGAAVGGILGKRAFALAAARFPQADTAGGVQAALLLAATFATLLYTLRKDRLGSRHVTHPAACGAIGLALGMLGSFLGIGGGPFNMAVLFWFFSMSAKTAALNSLYIILVSQTAGLLGTLLSGAPPVPPALLGGMVAFGVLGSEAGGRINRRLSERSVMYLFEAAMVLVMAINVYNICRFF